MKNKTTDKLPEQPAPAREPSAVEEVDALYEKHYLCPIENYVRDHTEMTELAHKFACELDRLRERVTVLHENGQRGAAATASEGSRPSVVAATDVRVTGVSVPTGESQSAPHPSSDVQGQVVTVPCTGSSSPATAPSEDQLRARIYELEHAAWHALEAAEEREDDCFIIPWDEGLMLSSLLPEEHPEKCR